AAARELVGGYDEMTALPAALRARLAEAEPLHELALDTEQVAADGTIKLRLATRDGFPVEAVAMRHRNRRTVCVSSQSGCPLACVFCATGSMGLGRNLTAGEISEQVFVLARRLAAAGERVNNVVLMGMGEPFLNYDAALDACRTLNDPAGFGLGARQIAVSTAGWVPGIRRLADEPLQIKLALSLHAPNDALRAELMPVDRRFPLAELMAACADYRERTRRRIFVEYLLLDGVNDADRQADELAALLGTEGYHVNLIAYNPTGGDLRASPPDRVAGFAARLAGRGVKASYRRSHGQEIDAACGQLAVRGARELRRRQMRARRDRRAASQAVE
ncbi:MAG TPA: 23S rRNA (adenine(2503)-C(2))-methyltransferase RlmN, partial [Thermoleophilia bacterium]|nr:23S rRNA (adenine(2503)-C(2))-methyltransferase RlmN [Thermoleophilia bacterium]